MPVKRQRTSISGQLAAQNPGAHLSGLAGALSSLGFALSGMDRNGEALAVIDDAIAIHRGMAAERPEEALHQIARCLDQRGRVLCKLARFEETLQGAREVETICRRLDRLRPGEALGQAGWALRSFRRC